MQSHWLLGQFLSNKIWSCCAAGWGRRKQNIKVEGSQRIKKIIFRP